MSETKWTPGPWVTDDFSLSVDIRALGNPLIAIVQSRHCKSPEEMSANAHIIAAAPELYEALNMLLSDYKDAMSEWSGDALDHAEILEQNARTALAKARGETQEQQR